MRKTRGELETHSDVRILPSFIASSLFEHEGRWRDFTNIWKYHQQLSFLVSFYIALKKTNKSNHTEPCDDGNMKHLCKSALGGLVSSRRALRWQKQERMSGPQRTRWSQTRQSSWPTRSVSIISGEADSTRSSQQIFSKSPALIFKRYYGDIIDCTELSCRITSHKCINDLRLSLSRSLSQTHTHSCVSGH